MNSDYFAAKMAYMVGIYGQSRFTKAHTDHIWRDVYFLTEHQFDKICSEIISTFRQAPLPVDFKTLARKYKPVESSKIDDTPTKIECEACYDSGFVFYKVESRVMICCDCKQGVANARQFKIPVRNKITGFTSKIDISLWKPDKNNTFQDRLKQHKKRIKESIKYWSMYETSEDLDWRHERIRK